LLQAFPITGRIDQEHELAHLHRVEQRLQLEHASATLRTEAAQVHDHEGGLAHERRDRRLPDLAGAEQLIDAEAPIGVGAAIEIGKALGQIIGRTNEQAAETAAQKFQEDCRLDRARGQVGTGNQVDAAEHAPARRQEIDHAPRAAPDSEHPQQQKLARRPCPCVCQDRS
jgi:hypothetical protein